MFNQPELEAGLGPRVCGASGCALLCIADSDRVSIPFEDAPQAPPVTAECDSNLRVP